MALSSAAHWPLWCKAIHASHLLHQWLTYTQIGDVCRNGAGVQTFQALGNFCYWCEQGPYSISFEVILDTAPKYWPNAVGIGAAREDNADDIFERDTC
jgi:hypothetical protein